MGNRGASLLIGVVVAIVIGAGAAVGYRQLHQSQTAAVAPPSSAPAASPVPVSSPSATLAPSPSPSSEASPTPPPAPAAVPPVAPPPAVLGPAAYPPQISAGSRYAYSGSGTLIVGATDSVDSATTVCGGINDSTQAFPAGYAGVYFVGIQFADGNRLSAGYERSASGRLDFATIQNDRTGLRQGLRSPGPTSGSHTYCVSRGPSGWIMTDDGVVIFSTSVETATVSTGPLLFDSSAQRAAAGAVPAAFQLAVPGFHDLAANGRPPRQLRGLITTF